MKALKPYMNDIKTKYKDNPDMQNRAIGKLYEDAKQNPLAGCFTSLAQLPIFLGLYRGVRLLAMDGDLQEPFLWIPSLQGPVSAPDYRGLDWLTAGWVPNPDGGFPISPAMGWETTLAFLVMPLILVLLQSATMSALQPPVDENSTPEERESLEKTQGILKFLPLMIGFFSLQVPAGLTIYWFTSNLVTLAQSVGVKAYFAANPPKIELPEYWDTALNTKDADFESMTPQQRRKAAEAGVRVGPTLEDLEIEAKFHCLIEREPLKEKTKAWQQVQEGSISIPAEFEEWVRGDNSGRKEESAAKELFFASKSA
jgi:YidC/Oxa1 family membrane protein insertase